MRSAKKIWLTRPAADSAALAPLVRDALRPGDVVLVKGALGSRMALIVRALTESST